MPRVALFYLCCYFTLLSCVGLFYCVSANAANVVEIAEPLFKAACLKCHGPSEAKGDLRLDQLEHDLSEKRVFERWHEIVERVRSGEMPPDQEPRPDEALQQKVLDQLSKLLAEAAAKQRVEGRAVLRRLNRIEYENTLRELFQVNISVKDMLPEDTVAHGFDNVGGALNISPVLMERYLDAADAVLTAATTTVHKLESKTERYDLYDSLPTWFKGGAWKQEEGVILFRNASDSPTDLRQYKAPAAGRYRFRVAVSAHNSSEPLPFAALVGNFVVSGNYSRHLGYFDAPPGEQRVIEIEERLGAKNDTLKLAPVSLPFVYLKQETMSEYPGPGLKVHWIEAEGPFPEPWPSVSYRRVFGDIDPKTGTLSDAEKLLSEFLPRAFRRPVTSEELKPYLALVAQSLEAGKTFDLSLRAGYKAVLSSPKFLYFRENPGELDDFAIASRLSYFLWSNMPDAELFELAKRGELRKPATLREQVERMLQDEKSQAFIENFTGQWLGLREINATTPDKQLYPEYDELLQWSSLQETRLFFRELLEQDLSTLNFIDSKFTFLNARLAKHYGIPNVQGVAMRKFGLTPEQHRGGVLTHASVLKITANGTNTSPVIRGVWVLDRLLGKSVPPPPPNVPAVEPDIRGAATIREQLAKHRSTENCATCHKRIDPPGFALGSYDVIGGWRERYRILADRKQWVNNRVGPLAKYLAAYQYGEGREVETSDQLPDGRQFANIAEFKKLLLTDPEAIARNIAVKLTIYATGHPVEFGDHVAIQAILAKTKASQYGLRSLIHEIVASDLFLRK